MPAKFPYIESIKVNNVRHLRGFTIVLEDSTHPTAGPVHLMLTGRNGVGKTSLLKAVFDSLVALSGCSVPISALKDSLKIWKEKSASATPTADVEMHKRDIEHMEKELSGVCGEVELSCYDMDYLHALLYGSKEMLVAFYEAKRTPEFKLPHSPKNPDVGFDGVLEKKLSDVLIEYLAHLKIQRSLHRDEGNMEQADAIDLWFESFTKILCRIFGDDELKLEFHPVDYSFTIVSKGKESPLSHLADGHAALLDIVADLILKMQKKGSPTAVFDRPGIVFIDEIETHLHLELQRLVMPILTSIFPHIQFIITTHSPFVLSSIGNTVVYDLENMTPMDNADEYSYNSLAEGYFGVSGQPACVQRDYDRVKELAKLPHRTEAQEAELRELLGGLNAIPEEANPKLHAALVQLSLFHNL